MRRFYLALAMLMLVATGGPSNSGSVSVTGMESISRYVQSHHLTTSLLFDGGSLFLAPVGGTPRLPEARALHLWLSYLSGSNVVRGATVMYARATLNLRPLNTGIGVEPSPMKPFIARPVWAISWDWSGTHSCPILLRGAVTKAPRQSRPVLLIAADGSGEGLFYETRGDSAPCAGIPEDPPSAKIAQYHVSIAWTLVDRRGPVAHVRIAPLPCSYIGETSTRLGGDPNTMTLALIARVLMVRPPCASDKSTDVVEVRTGYLGHLRLTEAPTGLGNPTLFRPAEISYFDGVSRTLQANL